MDPKGKTYSAGNRHHVVWAGELLDSVALDRDWSTVIDLGCGSGEVTRLLAKKLPEAKIIALDKFQSMIDQAETLNACSNVAYQILDIEEPVQDGAVTARADFLLAMHVFHWVRDIRTAVKNMVKLLKPGGSFFIAHVLPCMGYQGLETFVSTQFGWDAYRKLTFATDTDTAELYYELCRELRFRDVTMEKRRLDYYFDEEKIDENLVAILCPVMESMEESDRVKLSRAALEYMKSHLVDGKFHWFIDDLLIQGKTDFTF